MRRFKLYIVVALAAFFDSVLSGPASRAAVRANATFPHEQFDGNRTNNFFPC